MRKPIAKIGVLALVLVLCLATLGIGFAGWTEQITIDGTVDTGEVAVEFAKCQSNDPVMTVPLISKDPISLGSWDYTDWTWSGTRWGYDSANMTAVLQKVDGDSYNNRILLTMGTGYPGYSPSVGYEIKNVGSIPVKVQSVKLVEVSKNGFWDTSVNVDLTPGDDQYVYVTIEEIEGEPYVIATGNVNTNPQYNGDDCISEFSITLSTLTLGTQIEPDGSTFGDLCFRVEPGAEGGITYDFIVEITVCQWNAYGE